MRPLQVGAELRRLGHDVLTSLDAGKANSAVPDAEVLAFAAPTTAFCSPTIVTTSYTSTGAGLGVTLESSFAPLTQTSPESAENPRGRWNCP